MKKESGTVYNALAFSKGRFYVDGKINGTAAAPYYFVNKEFSELDDFSSGAKADYYNSETAKIDDGAYYLNILRGKITDDDLFGEDKEDAASELRKKLRKDFGLYNNSTPDVQFISANKGVSAWVEAFINTEGTSLTQIASLLTIYSDEKGNYMGMDYYLGNVAVKNPGTNGFVSITNTVGESGGIKISVSHKKTIASDEDFIYRLATLTISYNGQDITNQAQLGSAGNAIQTSSSSLTVIQKISKAQAAETFNGLKLPKTVSTYFVTDSKGRAVDLYSEFSAYEGNLVNYEYDGTSHNLSVQAIKLKDGDYPCLDVFNNGTCSVETSKGFDIAQDGTIFLLDKGSVRMFNTSDNFALVHEADSSMNQISVYDKNNLIVWNKTLSFYFIEAQNYEQENSGSTTVGQVGWYTNDDGTWSYGNADGTKATGWIQTVGSLYYMDNNGIMLSNGWILIDGKYYYLSVSGGVRTGWTYINGNWYFMGSQGALETGWIETGTKEVFSSTPTSADIMYTEISSTP